MTTGLRSALVLALAAGLAQAAFGQEATIRKNVTERLPLQDAVVRKQGNGGRKLVVFADPNRNFCRQFEGDLAQRYQVTLTPTLIFEDGQRVKGVLSPEDLDKQLALSRGKS